MAYLKKLEKDLFHYYNKYIIPQFSEIVRELKLISKHVERLQFDEDLLSEKKEFLLKILY